MLGVGDDEEDLETSTLIKKTKLPTHQPRESNIDFDKQQNEFWQVAFVGFCIIDSS